MVKAAVDTHSSLLAAAMPCRQTSATAQTLQALPRAECRRQPKGQCGDVSLCHPSPSRAELQGTWWDGAAGSELCLSSSVPKQGRAGSSHGTRGSPSRGESCSQQGAACLLGWPRTVLLMGGSDQGHLWTTTRTGSNSCP